MEFNTINSPNYIMGSIKPHMMSLPFSTIISAIENLFYCSLKYQNRIQWNIAISQVDIIPFFFLIHSFLQSIQMVTPKRIKNKYAETENGLFAYTKDENFIHHIYNFDIIVFDTTEII